MEYKKLVLKSGRERSLVNRHPWVFSGAIKDLPTAKNGEIIEVRSNHNDLLGYGFYSPNSQITCRVFEFTNDEKLIDDAYWLAKLQNAYHLRTQLLDFKTTNCFRLLHAEGDFFPGIIIDVYDKVAVVQLLIKGMENIAPIIYGGLNQLGFDYIYLKTKQNTQLLEQVEQGSRWVGEAAEMPIFVLEHGVKFSVNVETGQKTGFFIDQRENRKLLGEWSKGKKVLNTFSYSGGFSLYALEAGATEVHSVDSSKDAIALCEQNVALTLYASKHQSFVEDCFDFLKKSEANYYDIIILDPPAFAKNARSVDNAARGYKNLNLLGFHKVKPGGLVFTYSCSQHIDKDLFRKIVFSAAAEARRNVRVLRQLSQPEDHPINIFHPEGEYLKGLMLLVD
ncbi:MAG: class I SAM-dependent rRNA methyltransferase [Bacteroidia bacterium]|nr:class I SAM-dependent rRNA methyltransferase [Bacteroidia bacterium]MCF8427592.1 class I SAM-dependent rRNA methyltransferase [Bacteroidia bacterium]MCF8447232.1 class I SAM-dependent rRNA methyltransferase [Bacteroidia bacterium]